MAERERYRRLSSAGAAAERPACAPLGRANPLRVGPVRLHFWRSRTRKLLPRAADVRQPKRLAAPVGIQKVENSCPSEKFQ